MSNPEYEKGKAHMAAIPPSDAVWREAPRKYERLGGLKGCRETRDGYHVVEAGDNVCILCFDKLGGTPVRVPIPAQTPPAGTAGWTDASGARITEEPWSL